MRRHGRPPRKRCATLRALFWATACALTRKHALQEEVRKHILEQRARRSAGMPLSTASADEERTKDLAALTQSQGGSLSGMAPAADTKASSSEEEDDEEEQADESSDEEEEEEEDEHSTDEDEDEEEEEDSDDDESDDDSDEADADSD